MTRDGRKLVCLVVQSSPQPFPTSTSIRSTFPPGAVRAPARRTGFLRRLVVELRQPSPLRLLFSGGMWRAPRLGAPFAAVSPGLDLRLVATHPDGTRADWLHRPNTRTLTSSFVFGMSSAMRAAIAKNLLQEGSLHDDVQHGQTGWLAIVIAFFAYRFPPSHLRSPRLKQDGLALLGAQATPTTGRRNARRWAAISSRTPRQSRQTRLQIRASCSMRRRSLRPVLVSRAARCAGGPQRRSFPFAVAGATKTALQGGFLSDEESCVLL